MEDEIKLTVLFGRLLDLIRARPDATYEIEASLGGLTDLSSRRSAAVRLRQGQLVVETKVIPPDTPFAALIVHQFTLHGLGAMTVSCGASALDLLNAAWSIALDPTNYPLGSSPGQRLADLQVYPVRFLSAESSDVAEDHGRIDVEEAIARLGTFAVEPQSGAQQVREVVGARDGAAGEDMVSRTRTSASRPSARAALVERLRDEEPGPRLMERVDAFQRALERSLGQDGIPQIVDGLLALVRAEEEATSDEMRRALSIALRRSLTSEVLRKIVPLLMDEIYVADLVEILRRAGADGTRELVQRLINAPTFAERRAYLTALRTVERGSDVVASLLAHPEWYVVRNAADLVADLNITDAVPLLGRVVDHEDERVRLSVALALAKLGTPDAVRFLRGPLRDPDRNVRLAVARELGGKGLGALAMVLVSAAEAEEDQDVCAEYYRALGRIGTPEAVRALVEVAQPGRGLFATRKIAPHRRVAATEGLVLSHSDAARTALQELVRDRDRDVREAATAPA